MGGKVYGRQQRRARESAFTAVRRGREEGEEVFGHATVLRGAQAGHPSILAGMRAGAHSASAGHRPRAPAPMTRIDAMMWTAWADFVQRGDTTALSLLRRPQRWQDGDEVHGRKIAATTNHYENGITVACRHAFYGLPVGCCLLLNA